MSTSPNKTKLSADELLQAAAQLKPRELERFVDEVVKLRASRRSPNRTARETELMLEINKGLPTRVQKRFDKLVEKRQAENLTPAEHKELLQLVNRIEMMDARRISLLGELSKIRKMPLEDLMKELGIGQPNYV